LQFIIIIWVTTNKYLIVIKFFFLKNWLILPFDYKFLRSTPNFCIGFCVTYSIIFSPWTFSYASINVSLIQVSITVIMSFYFCIKSPLSSSLLLTASFDNFERAYFCLSTSLNDLSLLIFEYILLTFPDLFGVRYY